MFHNFSAAVRLVSNLWVGGFEWPEYRFFFFVFDQILKYRSSSTSLEIIFDVAEIIHQRRFPDLEEPEELRLPLLLLRVPEEREPLLPEDPR